jgi:chromosome segregation ATPase
MNDDESKELALYESVTKDIVATPAQEFNLPISQVLGRGLATKEQSFGGRSLQQNAEMVDKAIANTNELQNIWNHSHTQWTWKHINLSYHSPWKNMRQISAEISSKKRALNEAKWNQVENEMKMRKLEEKLSDETQLDYWEAVKLKIKLAKMKEGIAQGTVIIEGAMKDILALNDMYEQLKNKVSDFSEADVEKEESRAHLKRSLVQCIRDVRQHGSITKGEQEYMEQIGVNPGKMQRMIKDYVKEEETTDDWSSKGLYDFVDHVVEELIDVIQVDKIRMDIMGFDHESRDDITYDTKVAKLDLLDCDNED